MEVYYYNPELLPANKKISVDTILKRTKLFKSAKKYKSYVKSGKVRIRGKGKIKSAKQLVKVKDGLFIKIQGKGGVRVRFRK